MLPTDEQVSVRYLVDDVAAAVDFYVTHLGFQPGLVAPPAFAEITRDRLRLLISGPLSSAGRAMADGEVPCAGGWNRIHLLTDDLDADVARLREAGVPFRNDIVSGPGGKQVLIKDPASNLVELFEPAAR